MGGKAFGDGAVDDGIAARDDCVSGIFKGGGDVFCNGWFGVDTGNKWAAGEPPLPAFRIWFKITFLT